MLGHEGHQFWTGLDELYHTYKPGSCKRKIFKKQTDTGRERICVAEETADDCRIMNVASWSGEKA